MSFDYSALKGKIVEVFGTRKAFALAMGIPQSGLSGKLAGKVKWSPAEMYKAQELLGIPDDQMCAYFFKRKVHI